MALKIVKRKSPTPAPLVVEPTAPAVVAAPVPPPASIPASLGKHTHLEDWMDARPHRRAVYEASKGKPISERATVCNYCGHAYLIPCMDNEDTAECMNWKFKTTGQTKHGG